jgi:hypothetical protein
MTESKHPDEMSDAELAEHHWHGDRRVRGSSSSVMTAARAVPDRGRVRFVAAASGQRVVLVVDEHGLDMVRTDADCLESDDLPGVIAVSQESETGAL